MAKNNIPSVPKARFTDVGQQRNSDSVANALDVLSGRKGNGLDRAVLLRDLKDMGIANLSSGLGGSLTPKYDPPSGSGDYVPPTASKPTKPTGLQANGAFTTILLQWDQPTYHGHSHTEIWRSAPLPDGGEPTFQDAILRDTSRSPVWGDPVDYDSKYYYWVRHVNIIGQEGALNGANGLYAETSRNINDVLKDLGAEISESELEKALKEKVGHIDTMLTAKVGGTDKDGNEFVGGFGIAADEGSGTVDAAFQVDRFWVGRADEDGVYPFIVKDGMVYIQDAMIDSAFIDTLVAKGITAERINALVLTAAKITGGSITGTSITGNTISGGSLNIANRFIVNTAGGLTIRNANGNVGLQMDSNAITVKDAAGKERVKIGKLY